MDLSNSRESENAAREELGNMKDKAAEGAEKAKQQSKEYLAGQKGKAEDRVRSWSDAAEKTAETLHDEDHPTLGELASQIASNLNNVADRLRTGSVDDLVRETEAVARRDPGLFLAGSVALGFALSRFFKSSTKKNASHALDGPDGANDELTEPAENEFDSARLSTIGASSSVPESPPPGNETKTAEFERKELDHGK